MRFICFDTVKMSNSRFNNPSTRTTRSRSNSVSSNTSHTEEQTFVQTIQSTSTNTYNHLQADSSNSTNISSALVRSFRATGATNTWENIKNDVKKLSSNHINYEKKLEGIEEKLIRLESKFDKILDKLEASPQVAEPFTVLQDNSFAPDGSNYNALSVSFFLKKNKANTFELTNAIINIQTWIRTSLDNQKAENIEWDYTKSFYDEGNAKVTNNIMDFVGAQITSMTNMVWTKSISYNDLKIKISWVYRRQKNKINMPAEKREHFKRKNVLKTRRLTVSSLK